ncbi:MAG TPA: response regulator transcription factor [Roseiflexaceae bacterium]|nr:response regulator transcription factor [Roseiflexaceae bacterium]
MAKLRIFLADDHSVVREGLKTLVNGQSDMVVVGEADNGAQVRQLAAECGADVVIMDISMPQLNGAEATAELRQQCPEIKVLALSVHEDSSYVRRLLDAGASGYVLKRSASEMLIHAIRLVASGGVYLDSTIAGKLLGNRAGQVGEGKPDVELSEREADVIRLIAYGYSNKEIATQLGLSVKTVETYKARAVDKLGLDSRVAIVRYALQRGWLLNT